MADEQYVTWSLPRDTLFECLECYAVYKPGEAHVCTSTHDIWRLSDSAAMRAMGQEVSRIMWPWVESD